MFEKLYKAQQCRNCGNTVLYVYIKLQKTEMGNCEEGNLNTREILVVSYYNLKAG